MVCGQLTQVCVCSGSVQLKFESVSEDDVLVDPQRKLLSLSFWLNKNNYDSQQALLWCLSRASQNQQCVPGVKADVCDDLCVFQAAMKSRSAPSLTSEKLTQQLSSAAPCIRTAESAAPTTNP